MVCRDCDGVHAAPPRAAADLYPLPVPSPVSAGSERQLVTAAHSQAAILARAVLPQQYRLRAGQARLWTAIGICPATVTKSMPRPSQRVIEFAGRRVARSAPNDTDFVRSMTSGPWRTGARRSSSSDAQRLPRPE